MVAVRAFLSTSTMIHVGTSNLEVGFRRLEEDRRRTTHRQSLRRVPWFVGHPLRRASDLGELARATTPKSGDWFIQSVYNVLRKAISAALSSALSRKPNSCPGTARRVTL